MKLFKNATLTLPVTSCEHCPHKIAQRYKKTKGFGTYGACSAISRTVSLSNGKQATYHPSIADASSHGGFLPDCPLEEQQGSK